MPLVLIPNGYAEIGIEFLRTGATIPGVITFGVKLKAAPTPANIEADIRAAWSFAGSLRFAQPASIAAKFVRYKATWGGVALSGSTPALWTPGGGNPALASPQVAVVIRKRTGFAGRKMRGRLMLPWCSEPDVDANGTIHPLVVTAYNNSLVIWKAQLAAAARTAINGMYLLHSSATAPTLVSTLTCRTTCGTVRQREPV